MVSRTSAALAFPARISQKTQALEPPDMAVSGPPRRRAAAPRSSGRHSTRARSSGTAPLPRTTSWNSRTSKRVPSVLLGASAQLLDLQLAELVGERLARPGDVAVDLRLDLVERQRGVRGQVVDGLLARPAHRVDAGVDDEAAGAPHLVGQPAEVAVGIRVDARLEAQPLAVEPPALAERRDVGVAAEIRQVAELAAAARSADGGRAPPRAASAPRGCRAGGSPACTCSPSRCPAACCPAAHRRSGRWCTSARCRPAPARRCTAGAAAS